MWEGGGGKGEKGEGMGGDLGWVLLLLDQLGLFVFGVKESWWVLLRGPKSWLILRIMGPRIPHVWSQRLRVGPGSSLGESAACLVGRGV